MWEMRPQYQDSVMKRKELQQRGVWDQLKMSVCV